MADIILAAINAKWIHPSLALRLLKANLGPLETRCEIFEFALRQPLAEKLEPLLTALAASSGSGSPRILGISVSIWNHSATMELLRKLEEGLLNAGIPKPVVALGGPEVSWLPPEAEIFRHADYVIRGEGETAFRELCEYVLAGSRADMPSAKRSGTPQHDVPPPQTAKFINAENASLSGLKSGYRLYTDEDLTKKLIYVEASRGCPFNCEFCLSAVKSARGEQGCTVREFPLEQFLAEMNALVSSGTRTFKFLDRTFNINIKRAQRIMEFFLEKIEAGKKTGQQSFVVHFEMIPSNIPHTLLETMARFPPGTLRLEIGIQTLNPEIAARIKRPGWQDRSDRQSLPCSHDKELENIRLLREKTNAIIHADLIAGLPGEDLDSFGRGFDCLFHAIYGNELYPADYSGAARRAEIQVGILKLLPGAPIRRHNDAFGMRYNTAPPYDVEETSAMSAADIQRIKNFARFWEIIVNRGLMNESFPVKNNSAFDNFMAMSDFLLNRFGRNWGIDKYELKEAVLAFCQNVS